MTGDRLENEKRRCRDWLLPFMELSASQVSRAELCATAMRKLGVSRRTFDFAWVSAVEQTGRYDLYAPAKPRGKTSDSSPL